MSAINNFEVCQPNPAHTLKSTKKTIHFSDGSTMEIDKEQDDENDSMKFVETQKIHQHQESVPSLPSVNPKTLSWPEWVKHYSNKGASSVMGGLDYSGETLAYYLGITSPKYQTQIDEHNRLVTKKAVYDAEVKAWASTDPASVPIVLEQVKKREQSSSSNDQDEKV